MRSLVRYILTGRFQAITVVFGLAVLSYPFPFLLIFSGGALALITLQLGLKQGVSVLVICVLLIVASTFLVFGKISIGPLITWFSIVILALVYRNTRSLNLTLQALTMFGLVVTVLIAIMIPDMQMQWLNHLQNLFEAAAKNSSLQTILENAKFDTEKAQQLMPIVAAVMTGGLVSLYLLILAVMLFLGRWWQGLQDNILAFRAEFTAIRLGKVLAGLAILFLIGGLVLKYAILWQLAIVCLSMFSIQGIAIAHAMLGQLSSSMLGFVALYGLLLMAAPQMLMALSVLGLLDVWINFRVRFAKTKT